MKMAECHGAALAVNNAAGVQKSAATARVEAPRLTVSYWSDFLIYSSITDGN
jgi:hypothetical protein